MPERDSNRRTSLLTLMGALVLAFAVFGWGLHYKLSLYDHPGTHVAPTSHAKLLSQKERPRTAWAVDSAQPVVSQPQPAQLCAALLLCAIASGMQFASILRLQDEIADNGARRHLSVASQFFSFRPPPQLI